MNRNLKKNTKNEYKPKENAFSLPSSRTSMC